MREVITWERKSEMNRIISSISMNLSSLNIASTEQQDLETFSSNRKSEWSLSSEMLFTKPAPTISLSVYKEN